MNEQNRRELELIKEALPPEIFEKFRPELEMSQGRLLLVWLWRVFLMFVLPWRWKRIHDFLRPWREHRRAAAKREN
jgi:hypothetical protein